MKQLLSQTGARGKRVGEYESDASEFEWRALFVAGMWFQDLFNYDFRRTEMCIIPYGTQMGEVSFCAYNTGIGWRNIDEKMLQNATVAEWYKTHGRHKIWAKGQDFPVAEFTNPITARLSGGPLRHACSSQRMHVHERVFGVIERARRLRVRVSRSPRRALLQQNASSRHIQLKAREVGG